MTDECCILETMALNELGYILSHGGIVMSSSMRRLAMISEILRDGLVTIALFGLV